MKYVWEFLIILAVALVVLKFGWTLAGEAAWAWWDGTRARHRINRERKAAVRSQVHADHEQQKGT